MGSVLLYYTHRNSVSPEKEGIKSVKRKWREGRGGASWRETHLCCRTADWFIKAEAVCNMGGIECPAYHTNCSRLIRGSHDFESPDWQAGPLRVDPLKLRDMTNLGSLI